MKKEENGEIKMLKNKKIMAPPWIAYPEIERYSIGWRMGAGEYYMVEWSEWYDSLNEKEQKEYQSLFPEPVTWKGYWEDDDTGIYYENGDFFLQFWQENGAYKYSVDIVRKLHNAGKKLHYNMFWGHQPSADGSISKSCFSQWWRSEFWSVKDILGKMKLSYRISEMGIFVLI